MPIKNYTTKIDVYTSVGEIQGALARGGASKVMVDYEAGKPIAITFALTIRGILQGFRLPAAVDGTARVFKRQKLRGDLAQIERVAWRNIRDWVLAQMALVESSDVPVDEVFLPYLTDGRGRTLYMVYESGQLLLNGGTETV